MMEQETLEYRLQKLEQQNESILKSIAELRDSLPERYTTKELYKAQLSDLESRVTDLERSQNTALWAVIAGGGSLIITLARFAIGF